MTNAEIKNAADHELIREFVLEQCRATKRQLTTGNLAQSAKNIKRIQDEMLRRCLITQEDIDIIDR